MMFKFTLSILFYLIKRYFERFIEKVKDNAFVYTSIIMYYVLTRLKARYISHTVVYSCEFVNAVSFLPFLYTKSECGGIRQVSYHFSSYFNMRT